MQWREGSSQQSAISNHESAVQVSIRKDDSNPTRSWESDSRLGRLKWCASAELEAEAPGVVLASGTRSISW